MNLCSKRYPSRLTIYSGNNSQQRRCSERIEARHFTMHGVRIVSAFYGSWPATRSYILFSILVGGVLPSQWFVPPRVSATAAEGEKFFTMEIRPLLKEHCWRCHGEDKQKSGLRLDSRDAVLRGGQNGPAAVAGKPEESLLMKVLAHDGDIQMPPDAKLEDDHIKLFRRWIDMDLPWEKE